MDKSIVFILVLLPFVYSKLSFSPFEIPKTWVIIVVATLSVVMYLYKYQTKEKQKNKAVLLFCLVGLWGWLMITSWLAGHFWESWIGNPYRADGLLTLSALMILGLSLKLEKVLWWGLGWGSMVMSILTIFARGHTALQMGNPNFLAGYLATTLPITHRRGALPLLLQLIAIFMLNSWGGILVGLLYLAITYLSKYKKFMLLVLLLIFGSVIWQYKVQEIRSHLPKAIVAESRERIWVKALIAISEKPIVGHGWSQFAPAFTRIDWPFHYYIDAFVDRTHASFTEYGVAGGVPAMILYGYIAVAATILLLRDKSADRKMLGVVLLLYIVHSQTNITSVAEDWLFFVGVGEAIRIQANSGSKLTS